MADKDIVIYPRGFLGFDIGLPIQTQQTDLREIVSSIRYGRSIPQKTAVISNDKIQLAYKQMMTLSATKSMEFREKCLLAALKCFGTSNFYEWCEIQESSPFFTDIHKRFLNDTFKFIQTGSRDISLNTWQAIVEVKKANVIDEHSSYEYRKFFGSGSASILRRGTGVVNVIQSWVSQPAGFEDMISSLRIIFCDKDR